MSVRHLYVQSGPCMTRRSIHVRHWQGMRIIPEEHDPLEEEVGQEIFLESSSARHLDEEGMFCRENASRAAGTLVNC